MYAAIARAVLDEAAAERAVTEVQRLHQRHPRASRDELAARLMRRAAIQCAAAGALLTGPAAFFGSMPFGADLGWQVVALNRLVLSLAALYRRSPSGGERAAGVAAAAGAAVSSEALRQGLVRLLRQTLPRRPAARTLVGVLIGGGLGYGAAFAIGRFAQDQFRGRGLAGIAARVRP
jgi:hypothetical protein